MAGTPWLHTMHRVILKTWIFGLNAKKNSEKVIAAIREFGFESLKLTKEDFLSSNVFVQIGFAPVRIDVTSDISGITFGEAYEGRKLVEIEGIIVPVIGMEELIKNKIASGRLQDMADVEIEKNVSF